MRSYLDKINEKIKSDEFTAKALENEYNKLKAYHKEKGGTEGDEGDVSLSFQRQSIVAHYEEIEYLKKVKAIYESNKELIDAIMCIQSFNK